MVIGSSLGKWADKFLSPGGVGVDMKHEIIISSDTRDLLISAGGVLIRVVCILVSLFALYIIVRKEDQ